jgi:hypothetical protein
MSSLARVAFALALLISGAQALPDPVQAQTGDPDILVHTIAEEPSNFPNTAVPGLKLTTTFTLLEADGSVIRTAIKDGEARLLLGDLDYRGDFGLLPPDWSVVVLVDTSATLGNARAFNDFKTARDTLSRSLQNVPDNSNVALITFDDRAPTIQELRKDREGLSNSLRRLQAKASGSSCLNDGLYEAVNKLVGLQGRKAVFTFTASADTCGTRPLQQVVEAAIQNGVQLYAVGLDGYAVSQADLDAFTVPTGGLGLMTSLSRLGPVLDNLAAVLSNQWQAVWTLCPAAGPQVGELNLGLADTKVLKTNIAFESDKDYACPPRVEVLGMEAATRASVRFNVSVFNREAVSQLEAQIINRATGRAVVTESVTEITGTVALPAAELQRGVDYELTITALNASSQILDATDEAFQFRYEPVAPELKITAVDVPNVQRADFVITTTVQNPAEFDIQFFRVWLVDAQDNTRITGAEVTVPAGQPIVIPGADLEGGDYLILAEALDSAQQPQAEAQAFKVTYQRPSALDRLIYQLRQSQWAVAGLGAAVCLAALGLAGLVGFLVPRRGGRVKTVELALPEKARRHSAPEVPAPLPPSQPKSPPPKVEAPAPAQAAPAQDSSARTVLALTPATLNVIEPAALKFNAVVAKTPYRVGRRQGNDAVLPVEGTSGVSGQHLTLSFASGLWYVQDDNSTYGTTLNGKPIPKSQRVPLEDGAVLGLGPLVKVQFRVTRR